MDPTPMDQPAYETYGQRLIVFDKQFNKLTRISNRIGRLRLATVIFFGAALMGFWKYGPTAGIWGSALTGSVLLLALILKHHRIGSDLERIKRLVDINRRALARMDGGWRAFGDTGSEFMDDDHPYVKDLDIFGQGSLFQWLNACGTFTGRQKLAQTLSNEHFDSKTAETRRPAIAELAPLLNWRQNLLARSLDSKAHGKDPQPLLDWMKDDAFLFLTHPRRWLLQLAPLVLLISGSLYYFISGNFKLFTLWIPLNLVILLLRHKAATKVLSQFDHYEQTLSIYRDVLGHIEQCPVHSRTLQNLKQQLAGPSGGWATRAIAALTSLTAVGQIRYNPMVSVGLNLLFLWDLQVALFLERWKRRFGGDVASWFEVIGEVEMLSSLATLPFDNPSWCFPRFVATPRTYSARDIGHPLLDAPKRVCNDLSLGASGSVLIITGSNMSGKSTLLRTIGVNLVLAFAGAPVCARYLRCSPVQLLTSMRISDDLQHGLSTFYAELLRIRFILDAVEKCSSMMSMILMDEIFRGTNTHDRYDAARFLLEHLAGQNALTVIATHDLDLAKLEDQQADRFNNAHFRDHYQDSAIHFDYKLRAGPSTASNAKRLLELVGIIPTTGGG